MIMEIRNYKIRASMRDRFIAFFDTKVKPVQERLGIKILGGFVDLGDEDRFVWFRAFETEEERERLKAEFYGGQIWKEELEPEAFSMVEDYSDVTLVRPTEESRIC